LPRPTTPASLWSSGPAFYIASIGAAVGLGSVWRLPYQVGSNGGSAFLLVFTLACLLIAAPLLVAEFLIGRRSRLSPPRAAGVVAAESGLTTRWNAIGVLGTIAAFAAIAPYTVVAGWVLAYAWKCGSGALVGLTRPEVARLWRDFLASPLEQGGWHVAFLVLAGVISAGGVAKGLERAAKVRAPVLAILLVALAAYALATGDAGAGIRFAFLPDAAAFRPAVMLAAIGQAFYATGVGLAMMLAYGAYVPAGTSLVRAALIITASILGVSLLATLTIFPLVFAYGMNPAQGPDLVFDVLATVFAAMPGGRLMGTAFFVLLVTAALTPTVAAFEPTVSWLEQRLGCSRLAAVLLAFAASWVVGVGAMWSFNRWATWHPLPIPGALSGMTLFGLLDFIPSNVLLPLGALLTSVLVGWRLDERLVRDELTDTTPFARRWCAWALKYACPIAIIAIFVAVMW
jgi:neurotransmitter:Na+ symporter, NSS family